MFQSLQKVAAKRRPPKQTSLTFGPWSGGLSTEQRAEQLKPYDLSHTLNVILVGEGIVRTRDGSSLVCSGCTGEVKAVGDVKVGSTWYTIISDSDNKLYYDSSGTATAIGTMEGESRFCGFMGLLIIFDGSYVKMWDGTNLDICYDNGTGPTTPYQFNNRSGADETTLALGNGTNNRIAYRFTSQAWDAGYTIPPTTIFAYLSKEGNGYTGTDNVPITAKLRLVSDDSVLATKTLVATAGELSTSAVEYDVTFTDSDITTEMSPSTQYYASLEYNNGDGTNYVKVHCADVGSGGNAFIYTTSWASDSAKDPLMGLKPGMPPKGVFGLVHNKRLFFIEGLSGTNPAYLWYSASGNHLDYSTADGGGKAHVIDDSATNFPIGGVASWYGDLWLFGTPQQPYLAKLSGSTPSAYAANATLQAVSGDYNSIVATPSDIFFLAPDGVSAVFTIQEYGDIKVATQTDQIVRTIHRHFSSVAFAGYDPEWGLYLLKLEGHDPIIALHTQMKGVRYQGRKPVTFSPATEWGFAFSGAPTAFGSGNGYMLIGTDDGKVYKMDHAVVQDDDNDVTYQFRSNYLLTRFGELAARKGSANCFGMVGGQFDLVFYRNHSRTSFLTETVEIPWDPTTPIAELTMDVAEMGWDITPFDYFDRMEINFNFRALQVGIENIQLNGRPLYFGPITILADRIGGF